MERKNKAAKITLEETRITQGLRENCKIYIWNLQLNLKNYYKHENTECSKTRKFNEQDSVCLEIKSMTTENKFQYKDQ